MFIRSRIIVLGFCALTLFSCGTNGGQDGLDQLSKKERRTLAELTSSSDSAIVRTKRLLAENNTLNQFLVTEIKQNLSLIPISDYSGEMSMALSTAFANKRQSAISELYSLTQDYLDLYCRTYGTPKVETLRKMDDLLITPESGDDYYAFYLSKGDSLYISLEGSTNADYYLYNYDEQKLIEEFKNVDRIGAYPQKGVLIPIDHNAIYVFRIAAKNAVYVSGTLDKLTRLAKNAYTTPDVEVISYSECKQSDLFSEPYNSIDMINLLEEPRKITLRSVIKTTFSGQTSSLLSLALPKGTTDVAYRLRLSRKGIENKTDGEFFNNFQESYKKIRFLGIPVYEKTEKNTSLIREILNGIVYPPREEDVYCDLYVYKGENNYNSGLYDKDYSITQVQSSNGRIPTNEVSKLYLKFDNVQLSHDIYVWVEAIATVPSVHYMRPILEAQARKE